MLAALTERVSDAEGRSLLLSFGTMACSLWRSQGVFADPNVIKTMLRASLRTTTAQKVILQVLGQQPLPGEQQQQLLPEGAQHPLPEKEALDRVFFLATLLLKPALVTGEDREGREIRTALKSHSPTGA